VLLHWPRTQRKPSVFHTVKLEAHVSHVTKQKLLTSDSCILSESNPSHRGERHALTTETRTPQHPMGKIFILMSEIWMLSFYFMLQFDRSGSPYWSHGANTPCCRPMCWTSWITFCYPTIHFARCCPISHWSKQPGNRYIQQAAARFVSELSELPGSLVTNHVSIYSSSNFMLSQTVNIC
jgi:hypothetical protein